jgi:hypothetical protein
MSSMDRYAAAAQLHGRRAVALWGQQPRQLRQRVVIAAVCTLLLVVLLRGESTSAAVEAPAVAAHGPRPDAAALLPRNHTMPPDVAYARHGCVAGKHRPPHPYETADANARVGPQTHDEQRRAHARPGKKALVLYMVTMANEYDAMIEWDNFNFFMHNGLFAAGFKTGFFDGVDYIFIKTRAGTDPDDVRFCFVDHNIRTVLVPPGPCDLCAYARVLAALEAPGGDADTSVLQYSHFVLINSGARGPFMAPNEGPWIDVVAAAGTRQYQARTVSAALISHEKAFHPQSYFVSLPAAAMALAQREFLKTCHHPDDKGYCIDFGETAMGGLYLRHGFSVYSFGQGLRFKNLTDVEDWTDGDPSVLTVNPTMRWSDPCASIFTKFGGLVWRLRLFPVATLRAVRMLTMSQRPTEGVTSETMQLFDDAEQHNGCVWVSDA